MVAITDLKLHVCLSKNYYKVINIEDDGTKSVTVFDETLKLVFTFIYWQDIRWTCDLTNELSKEGVELLVQQIENVDANTYTLVMP